MRSVCTAAVSGQRTCSSDCTGGVQSSQVGRSAAQKILHEALTYLGLTLVNIVNLLNPSAVILGGGVTAAGDEILLSLRKIIAEHAVSAAAKAVQLKLAALGEEAGVLGMLALL